MVTLLSFFYFIFLYHTNLFTTSDDCDTEKINRLQDSNCDDDCDSKCLLSIHVGTAYVFLYNCKFKQLILEVK
jgi:hypothetical protein